MAPKKQKEDSKVTETEDKIDKAAAGVPEKEVNDAEESKKKEEQTKGEEADKKEETAEQNGISESSDEVKEPEVKKSKKKKVEKGVEEDTNESSDEKPAGLYDGPVKILSTKRERKSIELFALTKPEDEGKKDEEPDYSAGSGTKIKDIPYIKYQLSGESEEDLLVLYKLMYRKQPRYLNKVKANIYAFRGYPFDEKSKFYNAHQQTANKLYLAGVRYINELLGLERKNKTREEMVADLLAFLMKPKDLGLEVPKRVAPKKKTKAKKTKGKSVRRKRISQRIKSTTPRKGYVEVESGDSEEEEEESSEEEEEEVEKDDGNRRSKRTPNKKAQTNDKTSKKRKSYPSDDSSDDEILVPDKKAKKAPAKKPPTNAELKKVIVSLLKDADLGKVTMKNILHQVYDNFSSFDLSSKKEFLKKTIKECL